MKVQTVREDVIRLFFGDISKEVKLLTEEIVKMSNKINKRQMNGLLVCKIMREVEEFEFILKNKRNKLDFIKLKNNISNYLNDMLVD